VISKIPTKSNLNFASIPFTNSPRTGAVLVWGVLAALAILFHNPAYAQRSNQVKAHGEYQMLVEGSMSMDKAKSLAIERAKIDALRKEFGEVVVQGNSTYLKNSSTGDLQSSTSAFNFLSETFVNGEWVSDIDPPTINQTTRKTKSGDELWIEVKVYGYVRALEPVVQNCRMQTLSCPKITCQTTSFNHGQSFFMFFQSPVSGYLTVYLDNPEDQKTYKILPYSKMQGNISIPIVADKPYIFFDRDLEKEMNLSFTDELELSIESSSNPQELNKLFVIFSPNADLGKPILSSSSQSSIQESNTKYILPPHLPSPDFQRWLNTLRSKDRQIQLYTETITINR
jgi:hypothetical protein